MIKQPGCRVRSVALPAQARVRRAEQRGHEGGQGLDERLARIGGRSRGSVRLADAALESGAAQELAREALVAARVALEYPRALRRGEQASPRHAGRAAGELPQSL